MAAQEKFLEKTSEQISEERSGRKKTEELIFEQLNALYNGFEAVGRRFDHMDQRLISVDKHFDSVNQRLDNVNQRINNLQQVTHQWVDVVHQRFDAVARKFDPIGQYFDTVYRKLELINERVDHKIGNLLERFDRIGEKLSTIDIWVFGLMVGTIASFVILLAAIVARH